MQSASSQESLCGANLADGGQNSRLRMAVVSLGLGLILAVIMVRFEMGRMYRLGLFVPFFFATMGAFQGLYRTCPGHAKAKKREGACGTFLPIDEQHHEAAQKLGRKVLFGAFSTAISATAAMMLVP